MEFHNLCARHGEERQIFCHLRTNQVSVGDLGKLALTMTLQMIIDLFEKKLD